MEFWAVMFSDEIGGETSHSAHLDYMTAHQRAARIARAQWARALPGEDFPAPDPEEINRDYEHEEAWTADVARSRLPIRLEVEPIEMDTAEILRAAEIILLARRVADGQPQED